MLKFVVGYDFTELAEQSLHQAAALGARFSPVEIHAVAVLDRSLVRRGVVSAADYQNAELVRDKLAGLIDGIPARFAIPSAEIHAHARIGSAEQQILDLAKEVRADMIFVGTHGHSGLSRLVLGSVAEGVVRHAQCPVLVSRPKHYEEAEETIEPEPAGGPTMDHRVEPHVYSYTSRVAPTRPVAWPLY